MRDSRLMAVCLCWLVTALSACGGGSNGADDGEPPSPAPTVALSASSTQVASGATVILTWTTQNATRCTASGAWSGPRNTSGSEQVTVAVTSTYVLTCAGTGGSAQAAVSVQATASPPVGPPTVTLSASATSVPPGTAVLLHWSSQNASSCTASGAWSGDRPTSGSEQVTVNADSAFRLACSGDGRTAEAVVQVSVRSLVIKAVQTELDVGRTTTLAFVLRSSGGSEEPVSPSAVAVTDQSIIELFGEGSERVAVALAKGAATVTANYGGQQAAVTLSVVNTPPVAAFGLPELSTVGSEIPLDGTFSSDADGDALTYSWTLAAAPAGSQAAIAGSSSASAALLPDRPGTYEIRLTVRDARVEDVTSSSTIVGIALSGVLPARTYLSGDGPFVMTGASEVASNSTVTFAAGSRIFGQGHELRVAGTLRISGSDAERVELIDVPIVPHSQDAAAPYRIEMAWCDMQGGSFLHPTGAPTYGSFSVADCTLAEVPYMYLWYPVAESQLVRNTFIGCEPVAVLLDGRSSTAETLAIRNNAFVDSQQSSFAPLTAIEIVEVRNPAQLTVAANSFLDVGQTSVRLAAGSYTRRMIDARDNYWGTDELAVIREMVFDETDDPAAPGVISFQPFLTAPDPATPE